MVTNAIVTWMTEYLGLAVDARRALGVQVDDEVLAHMFSARSEPVQFFGSMPIEIDKEMARQHRDGYRPSAGDQLGDCQCGVDVNRTSGAPAAGVQLGSDQDCLTLRSSRS